MTPTFSVIVASCGRPTLQRTVDSIVPQLLPGDELLLDVNDDCPWGNRARKRQMKHAKGDFLLFMDDDDTYMPDAFVKIRQAVVRAPERVHIFRMRYPEGFELWTDTVIRCGNVSTQMVAVPNNPGCLGSWTQLERYEGDFDFISSTVRQHEAEGRKPAWWKDVIALIRPPS